MSVAVEDADTAVKIPGIKPEQDTNVNVVPSTVFAVTSPIEPTYYPPATNPNWGVSAEELT